MYIKIYKNSLHAAYICALGRVVDRTSYIYINSQTNIKTYKKKDKCVMKMLELWMENSEVKLIGT